MISFNTDVASLFLSIPLPLSFVAKKTLFQQKTFHRFSFYNLTLGVHILQFSVSLLKNKNPLPRRPTTTKTFATLKIDKLENMNVSWILSKRTVILLLVPGKTFVKSPLSFPKWVVQFNISTKVSIFMQTEVWTSSSLEG